MRGKLTVYAYDDTAAKDQPQQKPKRKYVFLPHEMAKYYSPSMLGPSYSLWFPWDAVGGEQKTVSLLPVFETEQGKIVMGQQAVNVLAGRTENKQKVAKPGRFGPTLEPRSLAYNQEDGIYKTVDSPNASER